MPTQTAHTFKTLAVSWGAALLAAAAPAQAQTNTGTHSSTGSTGAQPATEQVIVPQVDRRTIARPRYPSRDISVGVYGGTYATQNFGAAGVGGLRLAYHVTEDVFVDATLGQSKVSDEAFRLVLPGGIFVNKNEKLTYYNVSAGYNVLPGEVFFGQGTAKPMQGYILAGVGSTKFAGQRRQTVHAGFGLRLILGDGFALQADVRDHIFAVDLLGKRQTTQNLEATAGLSFYF
jgi:outer membrane beta-barrel protein